MVAGGASLVLQGCLLKSNAKHGINVSGPGSSVTATACETSRNGGVGAGCWDGGKLDLAQCTVKDNRGHGVKAEGAKSRVTAAGCNAIEGNAGSGAWIVDGGRMVLQDCLLNGNGKCGIDVTGQGSVVRATECQASTNGFAGARCCHGAVLGVVRCTLKGNAVKGGEGADAPVQEGASSVLRVS
jgi:Right handed beta helix region